MNRSERIRALLAPLSPTLLEVINDSAAHHGHAGDDGTGETHFTVRIASPQLAGLTRVAAQRRVYDVLAPEFATGLHALSIQVINN